MGIPATAGQAGPGEPGGVLRADLAADPAPARQARAAARQALAARGMDDPSGNAELLASELVANAAEHAGGQHIGFVLRRHTRRGGQRGVTREVTGTSPALPRPRQDATGDERGRARRSSPPLPPPAASGPRRAAKRPGSLSRCATATPPAGPPARSPNPKPGGTGPFKEDITMPQSASNPDERARHFAAIRDHARSAVIGLARCRGAELTTRPTLPDSGLTVRDLEPLDGARAAGTSNSAPGTPPATTSARRAKPGTTGTRSARPSAWLRTPTPTRPG